MGFSVGLIYSWKSAVMARLLASSMQQENSISSIGIRSRASLVVASKSYTRKWL